MRSLHGVLALALLTAQGVSAESDTWTLGTGLHYSSGDYGTSTETTILSVPFTIRYDRGPWVFRATVPYLEIDGAATVVPGVGAVSGPGARGRGAQPGDTSASGLGDIVASATYAAYYDGARRLGIDLTGKVKVATADEEDGLGTGEHDFAALVDAYRAFGRTTVFGGVGHHWLGSSPAFPLEDVWSFNVGASQRLQNADNVGLMYDYREAVTPGASKLSEVMFFWSRRLQPSWLMQAYVLTGLSDGSPDWGAGVTVSYSY